ncbi:DinB family protein [Helcobacillus sp. ACRRO]|uniref:mycothiol transferase n=1 Tax=Helcobacillus TaxID=1161125 RepID=UPI001EF742B0|nr:MULTISPECIES: DUF664 domain-containing protein [Helcobacillus]MCG7428196.1 DinB family protein [Helcobacillus sp. ACRRO]MDK7741748.1 DUF664 domain-containing protein [Helcobacillus massiliensis]WOO92156.1 DUF664 domain-containing protein [Helcobacillus massiliensis]
MSHPVILTDAARRPEQAAAHLLTDISADVLHRMPGGRGNSIAWLIWHAARQMDVQTAQLTGGTTVWQKGGWAERTGIDRGPDDFGFGDRAEDVAALRVERPSDLLSYLSSCADALVEHIEALDAERLEEVVDESWEPPVTRGVRIVSIIDDAVSHCGQAAYVRGLLEDWSLGV